MKLKNLEQNFKANILVVDDRASNLQLLSDMLTRKKYRVSCADNGSTGLQIASSGWSDLILLDINMPDMDGYEVCQQLKFLEATRDIPVIFLSASDEIIDKQRAFAVGGVDYITKPFQLKEVLIRIENQLTIQLSKTKIQKLNLELESRVRQRTQELEIINQELTKEIKEHKNTQKKLLHLALHDSLTGLCNRVYFLQKLTGILKEIKQNPERLFAVLYLDCDRFKLINDSFGHLLGDRVLMEVAERIQSCLSETDTLARFGGDEYAILLPNLGDLYQALEMAQKIQEQLNLPFQIQEYKFFCSTSIGIVFGTSDYDLPVDILRDADTAMYHAKSQGKARYWVFNPQINSQGLTRLKLETDLRLALKHQQLVVYYQPIICLQTDSISGFEALVRWNHPERGFVSPGEFIPVAEDTGLIIPLGLWVMQEACRQLSIWQQRYPASNLKMSVNLSVKQFAQPDLIEQIDRILQETQLDSQSLKLEITESAIMDRAESATSILEQLKERQIKLSIDDFGTGYSSLSYLHRFPVDTLKIDRSFINRIGEGGENLEIIEAIITVAHNLGMTIVAEGIETSQQKVYLRDIYCEEGQGYLFSKPLSSEAVESMLCNQ
ncbi:MAG: hypothetical protein Tsb0014_19710 [Pleurocapsa sp.]